MEVVGERVYTSPPGWEGKTKKPNAWLFYLVCDVSYSMQDVNDEEKEVSPWEVMSNSMSEILYQIESNPTARDIAHLSILAFADTVEEVLPLTAMSDPLPIGQLPRGVRTNFEAVFRKLVDIVPRDHAELSATLDVKRPAIFFITDGLANEDGWQAPLKELQADPTRPIITALGLGEAVPAMLCTIRNQPGQAWMADPDAVPGHLLQTIIDQIIVSVQRSVVGDDLLFQAPKGMRQVQC